MTLEEQTDVLTALAAAICYAMPDEQRWKVVRLLNAFAANRRQDGQQRQALLFTAIAAAIDLTPPRQP